ncbi:MAG: M20/M25/M40 family metallo-hydrolase [Flavobacteriaceae bacterium]|nr:M20/M25/M40 family metallo-hydrolase [Flavobacteriaceae bacterium]
MNRSQAFISFLLLIGLVYFSFFSLMPRKGAAADIPDTEFSTERALVPLKEMTKKPHYIGSDGHAEVREFLVSELQKLGLQPEIQEGYVLNEKWGGMDRPINIIAKIEGTEEGKDLLIFSHYDSALVPSYGASDAGSGVVTILESLRAFQASGKKPKNDIIVLFTDAEEVGLDGAKLFVREHPLAKDVAIALNFEARGSGGPSNMIIETNHGNAGLIKNFKEANPQFPVASSLMYSIYKMLPNDTDSTVLREEADIDGFFFAFIDDHFDYHTANDNYENLDRNSLQHQGSYLLPLLHHFADADLSTTRAETDDVYVNFPFIKMISYPFSWILAMLVVAALLFVVLVFYGIKMGRLKASDVGKGFLPLLVSLILSGVIGYFGWGLITKMYPHYDEIQHGFKYNGHSYVAFFVFLTLAILFMIYRRMGKNISVANLLVGPLFVWLLINTLVYLYLKGAAYFIIPVFFGLISLFVLIRQQKPNLLLLVLLAAPALFILSPLVQFFPVGLGSDHVFISCIFTVLIFGLLIPVVGFFKLKRLISIGSFILAIAFFASAHSQSDFSETRQKPNSLVYYQDKDNNQSLWVTYDDILDDWTEGYLGEEPEEASKYVSNVSGSKYGTSYSYASKAPNINLPEFKLVKNIDSINGENRELKFTIIPQRRVNQLSLYADSTLVFNSLAYNGKSVSADSTGKVYSKRRSNGLLRFYVTASDSLEVSCSLPSNADAKFTILEYSFDLMDNDLFTVNKRPKNTMPKPFVVTDAVIQKKTFDLTSIPLAVNDTITPPANE